MELLTQELTNKFSSVGIQELNPDPLVIAKYFFGSWTWLATEYDPATRTFFGYVLGFEHEWGYFSLEELRSFRDKFGLTVERDIYAGYKPLSEHLRQLI